MQEMLSGVGSVLDILPAVDYQKLLDDRMVQEALSGDFRQVLMDMDKSLRFIHALQHVQDKHASVIDKLAVL